MRIATGLVLLTAVFDVATALRGDFDTINRRLQAPASKDSAPPPPKDEKKKEDSKKKDDKKDDSKKEDQKKKKKKCKKANKDLKKNEDDRRRGLNTYTRSSKSQRFLQTPPSSLTDEDLPYCLHAEFSPEECVNLDALPMGGKLSSNLRMEVVHEGSRDSGDVLRDVEDILESEDTKSRFVGCRSMKAPPPPKRGRRALQDAPDHNSFEADEGNNVDVTGVSFESMQVINGACKKQDIPAGSSCNVVRSSVDIFYQSNATPDDADKQDMKDLLVETIKSQAITGSFGSVGTVEDVVVDDSIEEDTTTTTVDNDATTTTVGDDGSDNTGDDQDDGDKTTDREAGDYTEEEEFGLEEESGGGGGGNMGAYIGGVAALLVVFGVAYWYGMRGEDDDDDDNDGQGKRDQTSDESD